MRPEAFTAMRRLSGTLKEAFALGIILYDGRTRLQYGDRLWAFHDGDEHIPGARAWCRRLRRTEQVSDHNSQAMAHSESLVNRVDKIVFQPSGAL